MNQESAKGEIDSSGSIRLPGRLPRSCGFVRLNEVGALEVELYDRGDLANSLFGNDVAVIYIVASSQWPLLVSSLQERQTMQPLPSRASLVNWSDTCIEELPQRVVDSFLDIEELLQWLTASGIEFYTRTDTWA